MARSKFAINPHAPLPAGRLRLGNDKRLRRLGKRIFPREQKATKLPDMGPPADLSDGENTPGQPPKSNSSQPARTDHPILKIISDFSLPNLLRLDVICERYGVHRSTIYRWTRSGLFPQADIVVGRFPGWYVTTILKFEESCRPAATSDCKNLQDSRGSW
jgi:predicted DNA-binding transcriptional regulator AlpA